jgi:hypothetical protein
MPRSSAVWVGALLAAFNGVDLQMALCAHLPGLQIPSVAPDARDPAIPSHAVLRHRGLEGARA